MELLVFILIAGALLGGATLGSVIRRGFAAVVFGTILIMTLYVFMPYHYRSEPISSPAPQVQSIEGTVPSRHIIPRKKKHQPVAQVDTVPVSEPPMIDAPAFDSIGLQLTNFQRKTYH